MPMMPLPDMEMFYQVDDFTDPWTQPEVVLMHHGATRSSRFWYAWVPILARKYRVVRIDARGHGQSTMPPRNFPLSLDVLIEDVKNFLQAIGAPPVHYVGEMTGSLVGLGLAARYPQTVKSLSLCSTPILFRHREQQDYAAGMGDRLAAVEKLGVRGWFEATHQNRFDPATINPEMVEWYTDEVAKFPLDAYLELVGSIEKDDVTPELPRVQVPTLILASEMDVPDPDNPSAPHRRIPDVRLEVVPGGHRRALYVTAAEYCARTVLEFLSHLP